jgi:hypothetical protein
MPRYLVVAHQTADSPELAETLADVTRREPDSTFVLVVPATVPDHGATWTEGEAQRLAAAAGERARSFLRLHGVDLAAVRVGDRDPINAAVDEWNDDPDYDGVILSTLPVGVSRWLRMDAYDQLVERMTIPVRHVVAQPRS